MAKGALDVFETPEHPEPLMVLPEINIIGSTTVVALVGEPADGWAEVSLPVRPNGTTGWIRLDQVDLFVVSGHIVVDLSDRSLVYYQSGREVLSAEIGIGSAHSPTPTGRFYVTDSVTLTKKGTPWGPHALGLSARSDRITSFNGGDGIIGIHGTSTPASIGGAVSMGCVRLDNDKITRLHDLVPLGTPVEIRA
jgi:lipoprotein-anchoring transpeptidase ErfK/SrfK